jgi:anti-sigma B factor antagonist
MAQLSINQRQAGDVAILDLNGEVRIGDSATALRGAIRELVAAGNKKILLNLAGVRYIDSSGIGELIANYTPSDEPAASSNFSALPTRFRIFW